MANQGRAGRQETPAGGLAAWRASSSCLGRTACAEHRARLSIPSSYAASPGCLGFRDTDPGCWTLTWMLDADPLVSSCSHRNAMDVDAVRQGLGSWASWQQPPTLRSVDGFFCFIFPLPADVFFLFLFLLCCPGSAVCPASSRPSTPTMSLALEIMR